MKNLRLRALLLALVLGAACRSHESRLPISSAGAPMAFRSEPTRAWDVVFGGALVGRIVLFQGKPDGTAIYYVVRNRWNQDLGIVDALGRAYRYLPHHSEPAWVGTGTLAQGAARILALSGNPGLEEADLPSDETRASDGSPGGRSERR